MPRGRGGCELEEPQCTGNTQREGNKTIAERCTGAGSSTGRYRVETGMGAKARGVNKCF